MEQPPWRIMNLAIIGIRGFRTYKHWIIVTQWYTVWNVNPMMRSSSTAVLERATNGLISSGLGTMIGNNAKFSIIRMKRDGSKPLAELTERKNWSLSWMHAHQGIRGDAKWVIGSATSPNTGVFFGRTQPRSKTKSPTRRRRGSSTVSSRLIWLEPSPLMVKTPECSRKATRPQPPRKRLSSIESPGPVAD